MVIAYCSTMIDKCLVHDGICGDRASIYGDRANIIYGDRYINGDTKGYNVEATVSMLILNLSMLKYILTLKELVNVVQRQLQRRDGDHQSLLSLSIIA
jgi:hypothetical protein